MKTLISVIKESDIGTEVKSFFCVKTRYPPRKYTNGFMFTVILADKSGEIELKYWGGGNEDAVQEVYDSFNEDVVVYVSGKVGDFRGKEIDINEGFGEIRQAEADEYELNDFIVSTNQDINEMWNELIETKNSFDNIYLKKLLDDFFNDDNFANKILR